MKKFASGSIVKCHTQPNTTLEIKLFVCVINLEMFPTSHGYFAGVILQSNTHIYPVGEIRWDWSESTFKLHKLNLQWT